MPVEVTCSSGQAAFMKASVMATQQNINTWRSRDGLPPISVDGSIGPATIRAFQHMMLHTELRVLDYEEANRQLQRGTQEEAERIKQSCRPQSPGVLFEPNPPSGPLDPAIGLLIPQPPQHQPGRHHPGVTVIGPGNASNAIGNIVTGGGLRGR